MNTFKTEKIRNIALLGHGGSGKTTLAEAMLYGSKAIDRMGKVTDGNTVSDFDQDEIKKGFSLSTSLIPIEWKDVKINLLDAPGFLDFKAEALQAARAADAMIITVDAKSGLEVGAEIAWEIADDEVLPRAVFVSKCDDPEASFDKIFAQLRDEFGNSLCPVLIPIKEADGTTMIDLIGMTAFRYDAKGARVEVEMDESRKTIAAYWRNNLKESIALTSDEILET